MLAFGPGLAAWGLVTGVAMTQSGLGVGLSILMSLTVYAGSAQLASLPLLASGAPMWVIWASAFCVNLRFVIFSSQWRVHLGHLPRRRRLVLGYLLADLNLVVFQKAWPDRDSAPDRTGALRRRRRGRGVDGVAGLVARRHPAVVAGAAQLGPRLRRHAVDARHRLFAAQRPHRLGRGDRLRGGGGGGVRAAAQAQHPGRDRRGGGGEPGHGARPVRSPERRHDASACVDAARLGVRRDHDPRPGRGDRALARLLPLVEARPAPARRAAARAAGRAAGGDRRRHRARRSS